jgi:hypothetical protein
MMLSPLMLRWLAIIAPMPVPCGMVYRAATCEHAVGPLTVFVTLNTYKNAESSLQTLCQTLFQVIGSTACVMALTASIAVLVLQYFDSDI